MKHRWVLLASVATLGLHLLYLRGPLLSDEGGFAMVAHWWGRGGSELYGPQWVDRPPGLLAVFWIGDLGGPTGIRLMASLWAVAFVLAAGWAGWAVRGNAAAAWCAWAAFFLLCTPATQTFALNGELIAATCTMVAVAAALHAVRRPRTPRSAWLLALTAGAAAGSGVLVKQNFVDGLAFVAVLLVASAIGSGAARRRMGVLGAGAALGCALPWGAAAIWAHTQAGLASLFYAMYGFRVDAAKVLASSSRAAADQRMQTLVLIAVTSGIVTLAVAVGVTARHSLRSPSPLVLACLSAGLVELAGVALGGSFWAHYLIGLSPMLALAAGVVAASTLRGRRLVRALIVAPVVVVLGTTPAVAAEVNQPHSISATADWLRRAAAPGDTVVVLYSHANLVGASGLRPVYPYAWGLDADHRVERVLARDYVEVGTVEGHPIWRHRGG